MTDDAGGFVFGARGVEHPRGRRGYVVLSAAVAAGTALSLRSNRGRQGRGWLAGEQGRETRSSRGTDESNRFRGC